MNGLEYLINSIENEAKLEKQRLLDEASKKAEVIITNFAKLGDTESDSIVAEAYDRATLDKERAIGEMMLEESKVVLRAKRDIIDNVFELAKRHLSVLPENEYAELLTRYVLKASLSGTENVYFNATDREKYGDSFLALFNKALIKNGKVGMLSLSKEHRDIDGGFILEGDGIETDCSIGTIVEGTKNLLIEQITGVLFS